MISSLIHGQVLQPVLPYTMIGPRGDGGDDGPAFYAQLRRNAYVARTVMMPGAWVFKTSEPTVNGSDVDMMPGCTVDVQLEDTSPLDFSPSLFFNDGERDITITTLTANVAAGAYVIPVASVAGISVGTRLLIKRSTAYWTQREVVAINSLNLTLDRPVMRPYTSGDDVSVTTTTRDIRIAGNGARITGTGVSVVQFTTARDCHVSGLVADVDMSSAFVYDVASRDCTFEKCVAYCNDVTPTGFILAFGAENVHCIDCAAYEPGGGGGDSAGVYIASADNCSVVRGVYVGSDGNGIILTRDDLGDSIGCRGVNIEDTLLAGNSAAGWVCDIGAGNNCRGVWSDHNQTGFGFSSNARDNTVEGGQALGNTALAVASSGGTNTVVDLYVAGFDVGCFQVFGGELHIEGGDIQDTSAVASTGVGHIQVDAGVCRVDGVRGSASRNAQHFCRLGGGRLEIGGRTRFLGTGVNNFGVLVDAGVARVDAFTMVAASGIGIFLNGASAYCRLGSTSDLSGCGTPIFVDTGHMNRGQIVLNGTTPVAVNFGDTKATDRLWLTRRTTTGTPGHVATGAPTPGTGFSIASSSASDTSTFDYEIN